MSDEEMMQTRCMPLDPMLVRIMQKIVDQSESTVEDFLQEEPLYHTGRVLQERASHYLLQSTP